MRHPKLYLFGLAVTLFSVTLIHSPKTNALEIPPAPTSGYIVDSAEILSDQEESQLNSQIQALKDQSTNEIGILTVKDGEGVDPAEFSVQLGRIWGVGTKDNKNGAVIFISLENPKRIQIGVSTGLEGVLTDALSGQIARNKIAPKFKESKYYDGLSAGVTAIAQATKGEYTAEAEQKMTGLQMFEGALFFLVLAFAALQFIFALLASTKSWWLGGIIGLVGATLVGLIAGSLIVSIVLAIIIVPLGLVFDFILSKNYKKHAEKKKHDKNYIFPWYFGGGGGFGSGSSGGGFSGGGFSGGGSFGGGGGGSSW
jgi:uncharacterized protein